jgi:formylglycine-generating enzyme required for sulfatase activity
MAYQAFVASTYEDLKDHRAHVIAALRKAGITVDPMEEWTAAADEPHEFSADRVKGCDLCVLLVAFRRGHVPKGPKKSIVQLEYEAAVKAGIDVFAFLLDDDAPWRARFDEREKDPEIRRWRAQLKEHKVVGFFGLDPDTIEIAPALTRWIAEKHKAEQSSEARPARHPEQAGRPRDRTGDAAAFRAYSIDRYQYLDFRGMGVVDKVPLKLALDEMYVPLHARPELPAADSWSRDGKGRRDGRDSDDEARLRQQQSARRPILDLLKESDGLVILGDPGSGKTTCLKWLALGLARDDRNRFGLGPRLAFLLPLSAYARALQDKPLGLREFVGDYFKGRGIEVGASSLVADALEHGQALLLLDGLDEVRLGQDRHAVVDRVIDFFITHRKAGNKFVLTSRIVGYRGVRPVVDGLAECTLADFDAMDVRRFIQAWANALEKAARGEGCTSRLEAERERIELLDAVERNEGIRRLAANPLLLTILALMKRQGIRLPDHRVELYQRYVETLLKTWNLARGLDPVPRSERELDTVATMKVLAPIALWMHETSPGLGLVKREELRRQLEKVLGNRGEKEPAVAANRFLEDLRADTGLLLERGVGEYGFIHLTFQEYLAAVAIGERGQLGVDGIVEELARHVGDPNWREVSRLAVGYIGIVQQRDEAAGQVLLNLFHAKGQKPGEAAVVAGEALGDAWPGGVSPRVREAVLGRLIETTRSDNVVAAPERAAAGAILGRLGDPRFRPDESFLFDDPMLGFIKIPAGPFTMGGDSKDTDFYDDNELPVHTVDLPAFYMARFPVTVAQFRAYLEDIGVTPGDPDCLRGVANHPVVWVLWHEALAYCDWLTRKLSDSREAPDALVRVLRPKGKGEKPWRVTLASEAEWEKAARATDGRVFPWMGRAGPDKANYDAAGIGSPSAVGCFPGGASPYGVEELSGNVWEWTRSLWGVYPYQPGHDRENLNAGENQERVVRGGSFSNPSWHVRASYRVGLRLDSRSSNLGFRVVVSPFFSEL